MSEHDPHDPLWRWSATELAEAIRARRVSSVEVTTSFLDRIAETNDVINAIVGLDPADALAQAGSADRALVANASVGPLHGVPTSIKLNVDQRGRATTHGVTALADKIAENDAPLVAHVREAGGILLGGTNLPAFSLRWFSGNDLHGKTLNPWNHDRTPGGSSGGAAAVSAGMLPIAHGNDIGGSVRYPAFVCGVTAIRPTSSADLNWLARAGAGYVPPEDDSLAGQLLAVEGWMARSTRDLRLGLAAMSPPETRLAYRLTEQATGTPTRCTSASSATSVWAHPIRVSMPPSTMRSPACSTPGTRSRRSSSRSCARRTRSGTSSSSKRCAQRCRRSSSTPTTPFARTCWPLWR